MKEHKLGLSANLICAFLVMIIYAIIINTDGHLNIDSIIFLNLYLIVDVAAIIVGMLCFDSYPWVPKVVFLALYESLCVVSLFVNGSNYMMFQLMMLSLGAIALLFSRHLFNIAMIVDVFLAILLWFIHIPGVTYVYNLRDYLLNILCMFVEYVVLYVVQGILSERALVSGESTRTVEELIRVIGAKRESAYEASQAKSVFLANMSHEIRTPINAILGFNEMILRENADPNVNDFAMDIRSSGNSLLSLINDILDFSKIEAGKMEIVPVTYDFSSMLNDMINIVGYRAMTKGLSIETDVDPTMPHLLYGDEVRIKQIITNILTNAVKYTDDGYVNLTVDHRQVDDYQIDMIVKVTDTGQGIRPEDIEKLYMPFERLETVKNRNVEGSGLGLPLTRTLLELMGSSLEIESEYGIGSTFSFVLRQEVENWEPIGSLDEAFKRVKNAAPEKRTYFKAPAARILTVDDIPINIKVFQSLLKRTEILIDTASSGMESLAMMRKVKYDVIFMDHMMPEMDGVETLERMKGDRFNVNRFVTPVIALTANAVSGARELYMEKGFEDYLTKPIDSLKLEAILLKYLDPSLVTILEEEPEDTDVIDTTSNKTAVELTETSTGNGEKEDEIISKLRLIEDIDVDAGIETSGGADIFEDVVRDYSETVGQYSDRIENFYIERDVDNYRIQVHALKSISRLAGALKISELARELEAAADAGNLEFIQANTVSLLCSYRKLGSRLSEIFGEPGKAEVMDDRPLIDTDMLKDAYATMREAVASFDYDLIESVMSELENYAITEEYKDSYERIKTLIAEVNFDDLAVVLDEALGRS
ncbi:MAG: response regulator [Lachnospiraceae bacterium]|nr:response regulator [Lachnospiraceae bacterium]